eukprot:TRINITY_DN13760_c1_g1_i1.p1 TRINITY_DN13760_c1_g1~~TRINITY_DN13760_c1_g1_i1.p1  ORF type:complete len:721 (+),score=157.99 TRINITY_DN13760_c1_g1_i1:123-2165(+)
MPELRVDAAEFVPSAEGEAEERRVHPDDPDNSYTWEEYLSFFKEMGASERDAQRQWEKAKPVAAAEPAAASSAWNWEGDAWSQLASFVGMEELEDIGLAYKDLNLADVWASHLAAYERRSAELMAWEERSTREFNEFEEDHNEVEGLAEQLAADFHAASGFELPSISVAQLRGASSAAASTAASVGDVGGRADAAGPSVQPTPAAATAALNDEEEDPWADLASAPVENTAATDAAALSLNRVARQAAASRSAEAERGWEASWETSEDASWGAAWKASREDSKTWEVSESKWSSWETSGSSRDGGRNAGDRKSTSDWWSKEKDSRSTWSTGGDTAVDDSGQWWSSGNGSSWDDDRSQGAGHSGRGSERWQSDDAWWQGASTSSGPAAPPPASDAWRGSTWKGDDEDEDPWADLGAEDPPASVEPPAAAPSAQVQASWDSWRGTSGGGAPPKAPRTEDEEDPWACFSAAASTSGKDNAWSGATAAAASSAADHDPWGAYGKQQSEQRAGDTWHDAPASGSGRGWTATDDGWDANEWAAGGDANSWDAAGAGDTWTAGAADDASWAASTADNAGWGNDGQTAAHGSSWAAAPDERWGTNGGDGWEAESRQAKHSRHAEEPRRSADGQRRHAGGDARRQDQAAKTDPWETEDPWSKSARESSGAASGSRSAASWEDSSRGRAGW